MLHTTKKSMIEILNYANLGHKRVEDDTKKLLQLLAAIKANPKNKDFLYEDIGLLIEDIKRISDQLIKFDDRLHNRYYVIDDLPLIQFDDFIDKYYL